MATAYPEPSPGPCYRTRCCDSLLQSLHRYHVVRCSCGHCAVVGGAEVPKVVCHIGAVEDWLDPVAPPDRSSFDSTKNLSAKS
jgi:hypothetical protein